jgi:hypothetical protein
MQGLDVDNDSVFINEVLLADSDEGNSAFRSDADNDRSTAKPGSFMLTD